MGEDVVKINKKVFVFLGLSEAPERGMTVKLRDLDSRLRFRTSFP